MDGLRQPPSSDSRGPKRGPTGVDADQKQSMPPENGPGMIPLEDMRMSMTYSEATARRGPKERLPVEAPKKTYESDDLILLDEPDSTAIPVDQVPVRKHSLASRIASVPEETEDSILSDFPKHSHSESFGDFDMKSALESQDSGSEAGEEDEDDDIRSHIQQLYEKINALSTDKQIAEERAERAVQRVAEMKHLMDTGVGDIQKDAKDLIKQVEAVKEENGFLKEQLNDAQSHIFSLQPYRKDLTAEEVGREYDGLLDGIQDWVIKFMDPWLDDHEAGVETMMATMRRRQQDRNKFKRTMEKYPDLVHGAMHPETDEDIIVAIILRFLNDQIFQKLLYGSVQNYTEMISFIENHMQSSVEPKRDLFSVRTWTAEAYNAILSAPAFKSVRSKRRNDMTLELASILQIFCKKDQGETLYQDLANICISPAMRLYERLQVSTHHFYLDVNPYMVWLPSGDLHTSVEFLDNLAKLDCRNILQSRKAFSLAKLDPQPSKKQLFVQLSNVCTVTPALYIRQIGQKDAIKEPTVVRKQKMLVAWGSDDKRAAFVERGDRPLVAHMYFAKPERGLEGWAPFRLRDR